LSLVRAEGSTSEKRLVLRPSFPCRGDDLVAARACEELVFGRHFGNTAEELAAEYGPYELSTAFGAVLLPDGTAVGSVRLIRPVGRGPVKTMFDAARPPWNLSQNAFEAIAGEPADTEGGRTWDVATFGVDRAVAGRDRRVAMALLSVMFGAFRDNAVRGMVAMLDARARRAFMQLGIHLDDLPGAEPASYLGSTSTTPVHRRIDDLHAEHAVLYPHVHQQIFHGRGLDGLDEWLAAPGAFALTAGVREALC
jgi:hypothetical protein